MTINIKKIRNTIEMNTGMDLSGKTDKEVITFAKSLAKELIAFDYPEVVK